MSRHDDASLSALLVVGFLICLVLAGGVGGCMYGYPHYRVYEKRLAGEAVLREAEFSRQVEIESAKAALESAKLHAESEVIRAEGVAKANAIVAEGLGGPEGYLRYLWIQGLQDGSSEVIYIPTEAGLPILEAGKRGENQISATLGQLIESVDSIEVKAESD